MHWLAIIIEHKQKPSLHVNYAIIKCETIASSIFSAFLHYCAMQQSADELCRADNFFTMCIHLFFLRYSGEEKQRDLRSHLDLDTPLWDQVSPSWLISVSRSHLCWHQKERAYLDKLRSYWSPSYKSQFRLEGWTSSLSTRQLLPPKLNSTLQLLEARRKSGQHSKSVEMCRRSRHSSVAWSGKLHCSKTRRT